MKDEYIIINKTAIQKRIEELERLYRGCEKPSIQGTLHNKLIGELKQILSQSNSLIPELQKTWNTAYIDAMLIDGESENISSNLFITWISETPDNNEEIEKQIIKQYQER